MGLTPCKTEQPLQGMELQEKEAMASLGFIGSPPKILGPPPLNSGPPLIPKLQVPSLIHLVGPLAILDPHINICVGSPNTYIALKQFHLFLPNTLL